MPVIVACSAAVRAFQAEVLKVQFLAVYPFKSLTQRATVSIEAYVSGALYIFTVALAAPGAIAVEFSNNVRVVSDVSLLNAILESVTLVNLPFGILIDCRLEPTAKA